jgi:hypothetical protein
MLPRQSQSSLWAKLLPSSLHHAAIHIENPHWSQFKIRKNPIKVMYNPESLSLSQSARVTGEGNKVWFTRTQPGDLQVDLFFDTYEKQSDVRKKTNEILALTEPWHSVNGGKVPPTVRFVWADCMFTGIVTQVTQKFTLFLPSGLPVRAELSVSFTEVLTDAEEIKAQGLDNCRALVNVVATDRLDSIAYNALGDSTQWRLIADTNGIYDPIGFPGRAWVGQTVAIPDTHNESFDPPGASDYA